MDQSQEEKESEGPRRNSELGRSLEVRGRISGLSQIERKEGQLLGTTSAIKSMENSSEMDISLGNSKTSNTNKNDEVLLWLSERVSNLPKHFKDLIVHTARHKNPSPVSPTSLHSSGMSYPIERFIDYSNISNNHKAFIAAIDSDREPTSYRVAVRDRRWWDAMAEEIRALELNKTWTIEQLPPRKHPIGCKWVYKVKR
ncbi:hypothetical protein CRG98_011531 [Punica granatum]|uniref:Reverse transcriptase Ty1/copia-type domain-containing protein n=1 Tax=Punica granatum TaxID=22663 RepID=A0A2I0KHE3_PUNGR|nr:hypothetical protein CRG98_011531 [Punica granatum]